MSRNTPAATILIVAFGLWFCGCGESPTASISGNQDKASGSKTATKSDQQAALPYDLSTPKMAVQTFLQAVRKGDIEGSLSVLTPLARRRIEEYQLPFAPVGNESATFKVGKIMNWRTDQAEVATVWTEVDEQGRPVPEHTRWTVKKSGQEWRISGMTSQLNPDEPPVALDFENPEALMRELGLTEPPAATGRQAGLPPQDPFQNQPQ